MKFFKPKYASQSDEELLTAMSKGDKLAFDEIYKRSVLIKEAGIEVRVIHKTDLIALKQKAGRLKDLDDLENLK